MNWWRRLLRRQQLDLELDREIEFHLSEHTADLIAGGSDPEEARRQAGWALGGGQQVREECRDARGPLWLEDLMRDVRYALRMLWKNRAFAAAALLTLALGIGATTVMFTVINSVLWKPLAYPEPDRLVVLHRQTEKYGDQWGASYPNYLDCKRLSRSVAPMAAWSYGGGTVSKPGEPEYVAGRQISAGLFSVFGLPLSRGRAFLADEDRLGAPAVAIISYGMWQSRYGGSTAAIGSELAFDGRQYTVVGVAPFGFQLDGEADVYTPLGQVAELRMQNRAASFIHMLGRLTPGATFPQAQAELATIGRQLAAEYPATNAGASVRAEPLGRELAGGVRRYLWLLLGAVGIVLLIACVNVASLLLSRAVSRERELATRVALGAGRGRLIRQCLTESAILALAGGALGVLLAAGGLHPFVVLWPGSLPRAAEIRLDWQVLLFAAAASLASGLLFGLAPSLGVPSRDLEETLRSGAKAVAGGSRRLGVFVISEIALAVVLLVAAATLGRAVLRMAALDPGLRPSGMLTARVALSPGVLHDPAAIRAAWQDVMERARGVAGIRSVALVDTVPMREGLDELGYWTTPVPPLPNEMPVALATGVTPDYLAVSGIPLRRGRFFDGHDRMGAEPVIVIDEVLAGHAFPRQDAVGQRLSVQAMGPGPMRVVGIVGHVRHWGLAADDQAQVRDQIYYPFYQVPDQAMRLFATFMSMAVRTSVPPLSAVEPLRQALRGPAGDQALYEVRSMEQLTGESIARQRFLLWLFAIFAGLALLLASIGVHGVLAYLTTQRVPEIALRMALGATQGNVIWLVLGESVRMVVAGVALGAAAAWGAARVLERLVEGVGPARLSTFGLVIPVLAAAALFASFLPVRRATRVDPMSALRRE